MINNIYIYIYIYMETSAADGGLYMESTRNSC